VNQDWLESYLALLGIAGRLPTIETLAEVAHAHQQVLFANARSLLRRAATPHGDVPGFQLEELLASWHSQGAGDGVCYEVATMVDALLEGLGFESHVVLGNVVGPRSHSANVVELEGRRFLLDLGNGAPLFEPIPLDEGPYEIDFVGLGYRFERQGPRQELVQSRFIQGQWQPFVRYESGAAAPEERIEAFQMHHELPARSFVMSTFTLIQTRPDEVLALRDDTFTRYRRSGKVSRQVNGNDQYAGLIRDELGLPHFQVDAALDAWRRVTGGTI
jgi:arylamine N-acetyltransferase